MRRLAITALVGCVAWLGLASRTAAAAEEKNKADKIKVVLIDGQNNHD
jgi:hypothetical protein